MLNETAGNSIDADEIRNENRFLIFVLEKNKNCQPTKNFCHWEASVKPEVARPKARWLSSCHQGVFHVSVELSLAEMLYQQQYEVCLYHGQEVFKEMG